MAEGWPAVVSAVAVLKAGAVLAPVAATANGETLLADLNNSRPVAIITDLRLASITATAIADLRSVRLVVLSGGNRTPPTETCLSLEDTIDRVCLTPRLARYDDAADLALLLGAVSFSHRDVAEAADALGVTGGVVPLPPLTAMEGMPTLLAAIRAGAAMVLKGPAGKVGATQPPVAVRRAMDLPTATVSVIATGI